MPEPAGLQPMIPVADRNSRSGGGEAVEQGRRSIWSAGKVDRPAVNISAVSADRVWRERESRTESVFFFFVFDYDESLSAEWRAELAGVTKNPNGLFTASKQ